IGGLCSLENPVHVAGRHGIVFEENRAIANQAALPHHVCLTVACRQTGACRKGDYFGPVFADQRFVHYQKRVRSQVADRGKCPREILVKGYLGDSDAEVTLDEEDRKSTRLNSSHQIISY